VEGITN